MRNNSFNDYTFNSQCDRGEATTSSLFEERPQDKCGVFGIYNYKGDANASTMAYYGLLALQHRGQESSGIAYNDQETISCIKGMGLVDHVFSSNALSKNSSTQAIGHVRYSTTGLSEEANAQPLLARSQDCSAYALAHNGNLTNTAELTNILLSEGQIFHTNSDTEIILAYIFRHRRLGLVESVKMAMRVIRGAYAVVVMNANEMVAFRDQNGFRPLVMGMLKETYVFASESSALDAIGASFIRDIEPGEIVHVGPQGICSTKAFTGQKSSLCIFEYIYFARPDSIVDGKSVYLARKKVGSLLAKMVPSGIDLVVPSPDSGVSAAIGLAEALKVPYDWGIYRNAYLGRTFIEPTQDERQLAVRLKLSPVKELLEGKKVIVVDDSLVRGTTARVLAKIMRHSGVKEVHLCIASPPYIYPCYYGINIPLASELAYMKNDVSGLCESLGVDSITFAQEEDLYKALNLDPADLCTACFSGDYPVL